MSRLSTTILTFLEAVEPYLQRQTLHQHQIRILLLALPIRHFFSVFLPPF